MITSIKFLEHQAITIFQILKLVNLIKIRLSSIMDSTGQLPVPTKKVRREHKYPPKQLIAKGTFILET